MTTIEVVDTFRDSLACRINGHQWVEFNDVEGFYYECSECCALGNAVTDVLPGDDVVIDCGDSNWPTVNACGNGPGHTWVIDGEDTALCVNCGARGRPAYEFGRKADLVTTPEDEREFHERIAEPADEATIIECVGCAHDRHGCFTARTCGSQVGHTWEQNKNVDPEDDAWYCTTCCAIGHETEPETDDERAARLEDGRGLDEGDWPAVLDDEWPDDSDAAAADSDELAF